MMKHILLDVGKQTTKVYAMIAIFINSSIYLYFCSSTKSHMLITHHHKRNMYDIAYLILFYCTKLIAYIICHDI
jgi:hypothetical protein